MSQLDVNSGDVFLFEGPASLTVDNGLIEIVGAELSSGDSMQIPRGKTLPVEGLDSSSISFDGNEENPIEQLPERTIPGDWDNLVENLQEDQPEIVLTLGEMDTGKTFFNTYITNKLLGIEDTVSVMDCDLGQTDIGPPGTVGVSHINEPTTALDEAGWDSISFVGSHSPGLHMVPFLSSIRSLADDTLNQADTLLVDTTGWVQGDGGRAVKQGKIDMMDPEYVVLLQKDRELEHLVKTISEDRIHRVTVSDKVQETPPSERQSLRERNMISYMEDASQKTVDLNKVATERVYYRTGKSVDVSHDEVLHLETLSAWEGALVVTEGNLSEGVRKDLQDKFGNLRTVNPNQVNGILVGFADEHNRCAGVGVIETIDFNNHIAEVHTPLDNPEQLDRIQFGSVRYTSNGEENGFVEPGSL